MYDNSFFVVLLLLFGVLLFLGFQGGVATEKAEEDRLVLPVLEGNEESVYAVSFGELAGTESITPLSEVRYIIEAPLRVYGKDGQKILEVFPTGEIILHGKILIYKGKGSIETVPGENNS